MVRATMIHPGPGARAPINDPTVKTAVPIITMRLRPVRSASTPEGISTAALTMVNRLLIHDIWAGVEPGNASRIAGNVTTMIDMLSPVSTVVALTMVITHPVRTVCLPAGDRTGMLTDVKYWLPYMFEDTSQLLDVARAAEAAGFEGIALADHVAVPVGFASVHPSGQNPFDERTSFPEPFTCIAAMATVTSTLKFMPYVYIAPMREPFSVAKIAGTTAALTNHRLALGVGAGWLREEMTLLGHDPSTRGRRLDEMIEIVRRFWRDGTTEFHGEHYDFGPTGMYPQPGGPIPVWVGGKSPAALARAARNDGWLGMNYDLDEIDALLTGLAEARARVADAGTATGPFETMVVANALPTPSLMDDLEGRGVTSTIGTPWRPGDPAFASLAAKLDAIVAFSDRFISRS
jgi:probable F420-dependent oxidoreductase